MRDYIALAKKSYTDWWRYFIGTFFIFILWQMATIFLPIAVLFEKHSTFNLSLLGELDFNDLINTLDSNLTLFLYLISFVFGFLGIYLVVRVIHFQKWKNLLTTRTKFDWGRVLTGFSIIGFFIIISTLIDYWVNPEEYIFNFKSKEFIILACIALILVPVQTSFEELFFRGYLMQGIGVIFGNRAFPLIITSVVFGLLHLGNPEVEKLGPLLMVNYIGTGFLLGIMTLMDEGLEIALGYHAGNNLITALLVTADWTAFQTESILISTEDPTLGIEIFFPVLIIYPLFLLFLARKYKWNNWKERLFGSIDKVI